MQSTACCLLHGACLLLPSLCRLPRPCSCRSRDTCSQRCTSARGSSRPRRAPAPRQSPSPSVHLRWHAAAPLQAGPMAGAVEFAGWQEPSGRMAQTGWPQHEQTLRCTHVPGCNQHVCRLAWQLHALGFAVCRRSQTLPLLGFFLCSPGSCWRSGSIITSGPSPSGCSSCTCSLQVQENGSSTCSRSQGCTCAR